MNIYTNWVEIDTQAIAHNLASLKEKTDPSVFMVAVMKADAYGHGLLPVARIAKEMGVSVLAVANLLEAEALCSGELGLPILILGGVFPDQAERIVRNGFIQTIYSADMLLALEKEGANQETTVSVHFKVETGMNRLGVRPGQELQGLLETAAQCPHIHVDGVFSHLAVSDESDEFTHVQVERFREAVRQVEAAGFRPKRHIANSAAILRYPHTHFDCVRAGIAMYGLNPAQTEDYGLLPALSWKTRIALCKEIEPGETVSYGRTYKTSSPTRVATLPVGYADGYARCLGGKASVLIHGQKAPVVGRVCMDYCMADVTNIPNVQPGDEVTLIGQQDGETLTAHQIALWMDTIHYEVVTGIGKRVPRIYI